MRKSIPRMSKHVCVLILFTLFALVVNAQNTVKGVVTAKDGSPIAGVTVSVKGTKIGTQTTSDGSFTITVPKSSNTLVLTAVGYARQEVPVRGQSLLSISLETSTSTLTDVVVIGYGTTRKKDLTGSISVVSEKDFQKGVISTPEQMIAGKIAGVSIISNSGQPGAGSTIRIRGGSSLLASNDPLIIIDGIPFENS